MLMLTSIFAIAQQRNISGVVLNAKSEPVPFASIKVKGTSTGVTADENGKFTISVKTGSVLVISNISIKTKEVEVGSQTTLSIITEQNPRQEEIVVVTGAMNIKKSQRNQVASAQTLSAEQINTTRQPNLINGLAGKVVGTQARSQSTAKLDQAATLRIRGGSSLSGDRGAIFVVDGTIVNSFDINPDDIESTTILKGANATVLFGDRAANGAVVITTRKKAGKSKLRVELNQAVTFEDVNVTMQYQNKYAGGAGGWRTFNFVPGMPAEWASLNGQRYHDMTDDASWGPRIDGGQHIPWYAWIPGTQYTGKTTALTAQPSNINDFWETGITTNTNLTMFKDIKKGSLRVTYNNTQIKGVLPETRSGRNTFTLSGDYEVLKNLTLSANINYSINNINGNFDDGYSNNSTGSFSSWFHRDLDFKKMKEFRNLRTPIGTLASWNPRNNPNTYNPANPGNFWRANYWYNPYSYFDNIDFNLKRDRLFGDVKLAYKVAKGLNVSFAVRNNTLNTLRENITKSIVENSALQSGTLAGFSTDDQKFQENNYEFLATYKKNYKKFDFDYLVGGNVLDIKNYRDFATTDGGLNVDDVYTLANSANPVIRNLKPASGPVSQTQNRAWFSQLDVNYNKYLNLSGAVRQDWYSVLPVDNNLLTSYSFGAGLIFSDLLKDNISWLSYGKLYGSIGQKPLAPLGFGATDSRFLSGGNFVTYSPSTTYWGTDTLMSTPNGAVDGNINGIIVKTNEIGLDLKFVKNRLGLNLTYYDETIDKEPVAVSVAGTSGYTSRTANAGKILRQGLEVELFVHAVKKNNFDWKANFNIAKLLNNDVIDVDGDASTNDKRILLSGGAFGTRFARAFQVEGMAASQLIGGGIMRNADGQAMIGANGLFATDAAKNWGSTIPTVTGGFFNNFRFGNFTAAINMDYQFGGKFFSLSESWGTFSGLLDWTATVNDRGMEIRDPLSAGGGVRVRGVSAADGKTPVDMYVDAQTYFQQFYNNQIAEPFVHSLSFIKLREISLGYDIPLNKFKNVKWIKGANFSILSRNPFIIYREAKNFDPSEISGSYGEDGNLPATRALGINLKLTF